MSARDAYVEKLQAQLDVWSAEIATLRAKASKAEADAKFDLKQRIEELEGKQSNAKAKIDEIRHASEDAWEDLRHGVESAWRDLGDAVKSATSRFG